MAYPIRFISIMHQSAPLYIRSTCFRRVIIIDLVSAINPLDASISHGRPSPTSKLRKKVSRALTSGVR